MAKRIIVSVFIAAALLVSFPASASAEQPGFDNFIYSHEYDASGQFADVNDTDWFAPYVEDAFNFGLIRGKSATTFDPGGSLTLGEAVTLIVRLSCIYYTGAAEFPVSEPFYEAYADYALAHGIIDDPGDYNALATRAQFAKMAYNALPPEALPEINAIPDYGICDVMPSRDYGPAVYSLYRAGVFSGSDRYGTFFPESGITRAEICAIMVRLASPADRVMVTLPARLPAEVIFQRSADAVFMLETFSETGSSIRTGSGFFISDTGLAVTALHVIDDAASASVKLYNGDVYPVSGVVAMSRELNLAIISVGSGRTGWSFLNLADSDLIEEGNTVYAIGSPRELINTITEGIVSSKRREVGYEVFIQFSAPISFGSGGSALLNSLGQVIGIASSSFSYGQNLNLALPSNFINDLEIGEMTTLESLLQQGRSG